MKVHTERNVKRCVGGPMVRNFFKKKEKLNNDGFSMVELLVATAILGIVSVIIYSFMVSGSRFYEKTSADTDIQMEAQLVANQISDLIIDCEVNIRYDESVSDQIPDAFNSGSGSGDTEEEGGETPDPPESGDGIKADPDDGKTLEIDNCDYQFLIINGEDDKLYYLERTADPATNTYVGDFDLSKAELLAENVSEFSVDLSRVKGKGQENIVTFSMTYTKGKRSYSGIYQVNLRNQVTVNEVVTEVEDRKTTIDKLVMSPDVYVTIKGKDDPELFVASDRNLSFNVSYKASNLSNMNDLFTWSMDSGYGYELPEPAPTGTTATISMPADYNLNNLSGSNFRVTVQSNIASKTGEKLSASAQVYFKKVQSVTVTPRSGIVNGEAAANSAVMLNGLVDGWHLDNSEKYVTWKLQYYTDNDATLKDCPANVATIGTSRTSAYIQIGDRPDETYHFVVTATSQFDTDWVGEYEFDIYEAPEPEYPDDACRGVEIDIFSYFEKYPDKTGQGGNLQEIVGIENLYVQNVPGWDGTSADLFEVKIVDGRLKVYLNYEDYKYQSVMQLINYYKTATVDMPCTLYYIRKDNGQLDSVNAVLKLELEGTSIKANQGYPDGSAIVIPYGGYVDIPFITSGYNITAKNHIGVYLDDQNVNANMYGMLDLNNYISGDYRGSLGSRSNLVKTGTVRLSSKSGNPNRPVGSIDAKITVDDMYRLLIYMKTNGNNDSSFEDAYIGYKVYVANVEDANVYVPGPNEGAWTIVSGSGTTVSCSDIAPSNINGTISAVTVNGNEVYQLSYAGNTYYYNKTYHYWQKQ